MNDAPSNLDPTILAPFIAAMQEKDEDDQFLLSAVFFSLSDKSQDVLVGEQTLQLLKQWNVEGLIPDTHLKAVSKLIGLATLDDEVPASEIPNILSKIGIPQEQAAVLGQKIQA